MKPAINPSPASSREPVRGRPSLPMRRLSKYQSCGMFKDDTTGAVYTRAISAEELRAAYRLVHDIFVENNYIHENSSGLRVRPFETDVNNATFIAHISGKVVGSIGLVIDTEDLGLPSDKSFRSELDALRADGKRLCEVTNQAILFSQRHSSVCTELMRCAWAQAWMSGYTDMVCSISPNQRKFYEFIGFELIGDERSFSDEIDDPVINMRWDLAELRRRWPSVDIRDDTMDAFWKRFFLIENAYISDIHLWNSLADGTFSNLHELIDLFGDCEHLFMECNFSQFDAIRERLGDFFDIVYGIATRSTSALENSERISASSSARRARISQSVSTHASHLSRSSISSVMLRLPSRSRSSLSTLVRSPVARRSSHSKLQLFGPRRRSESDNLSCDSDERHIFSLETS